MAALARDMTASIGRARCRASSRSLTVCAPCAELEADDLRHRRPRRDFVGNPLSPAAQDLQAQLWVADLPVRIWAAWEASELEPCDLRELLPHAWLYGDSPEQAIGSSKWTILFRASGFLMVPTNLAEPTGPLRIFRGATEERVRGMAWYLRRENADQIRSRHVRYGPTAVYAATASREAMLAHFKRLDDGPELVVDPDALDDIDRDG